MNKKAVFLIVMGCLGLIIWLLLNSCSADKKALEIISAGRVINLFCWQKDGEKCLIIGFETIITDNKYFISAISVEHNYISVEIFKIARKKEILIVQEFLYRDFDFLPYKWKKIVQDKIKEHLGLAQNSGV